MGSVCCTASRSRELAETSDDWSIDHVRVMNAETAHVTLSPPYFSSRREVEPQISEFETIYDGIFFGRTVSSSNTSARSNSVGSERQSASSHHRPETRSGMVDVLNSPSDSSCYFQQSSLDHTSNSVATSSCLWKKCTTATSQEEPGAPAYSAIPSKLMEEFSFGPSANQVHYFPKLNISKSMQSMGSSPGSEMDDDANEVTATRFHSYQQMLRNTVDTPFKFSRQKAESQRTSSSSDFLDHLDPRSWRWSGRGFPSMITVGEQEDLNELYIANTVPVCNHNPSTQFESPTCGLCSKAVSQKSLWSFPRALTNKDLPVVGILECGHVYHAECLERATPDALSHDPPCPKCGVKGTKPKMQQGNLTKSEARDPPIIKGQLFHAGVSSYESNDDAELNKSSEMGGHQSCLSEESRKGLLHLTVHTSDKPSVTRSLLRKQFPFRAKVSREAMTSSFGSIRPGYAARVSPENNSRDDDFVMGKKAY